MSSNLDTGPLRAILALAFVVLATLPLLASATCNGRYAKLASYAGKSMYSSHLLAAPLVTRRLARLATTERNRLERNLGVSGQTRLEGCHLVVAGNLPHRGLEQNALLDINLDTGTVIAGIHSGGRIDIHVIRDPSTDAAPVAWNTLPKLVRHWAVKADMGFPKQQPQRFPRPRSVHLHLAPAESAGGKDGAAAATVKITNNVKPTPQQSAAIRHAAGSALADCNKPDNQCFRLSLADINADGRDDLIAQYSFATGYCGSAGCSGIIVLATANGYSNQAISLPTVHEIEVLPGMHGGMHNMEFDNNHLTWKWNGRAYRIDKSERPSANTPPWKSRQAGDRTVALGYPVDSVIKTLSVFCNKGKPTLAMLLKMPRANSKTNLVWVFNGRLVGVPMRRANDNGTLWLADLSGSYLPRWLASSATHAFLRFGGDMQGQISLDHSTATTRTALQDCSR